MGVWGDSGAMPAAVAAMHGDEPDIEARGVAAVQRGTGIIARLVARIIGFPDSAVAVPLHVRLLRNGDSERWERRFAGQAFHSRLTRRDGLVTEHFGPLAFGFDLVAIPGGHAMQLRRWQCGPLRLPLLLAPRISASETEVRGRFAFDVCIDLPLFGLLIAYRGSLAPVPKAIDPATWSLSDEHASARRRRG
ncbi:MAG: DUF4166 domain-containing protein [Polymorphobacter sp.]